LSAGTAIARDGNCLLVSVKARPGAKRDAIRGEAGGYVLVDVAAPARDGQATERLLAYLADRFGVARRNVELVAGDHARWKRVRIHGPTRRPAELEPAVGA
jgi:uncharacterized protein (TIGR00251 family)